uniref:SAM domain-containing protein n=1 Tax=Oryza nivara TaxID=4536 RepID=A0A0E0IKA7_ORYNI
MPANPKLAAKPSPSPPTAAAAASRPKATAKPPLGAGYRDNDDDDDDFQSPPRASSRAARALKPSGNGAASRRPSKRLKPSSSCCSGKENLPAAAGSGRASAGRAASKGAGVGETLGVVSRVSSGVPGGDKARGGGICGLLRCGSDDFSSVSNGKKGLDRYWRRDGGLHSRPNPMDSTVSMPDATCDLENGGSQVAQMLSSNDRISVQLEGNAKVDLGKSESDPTTMRKERNGSGACESDHPARLIEPRLLTLVTNCDFGGADSMDSKELGSAIHPSVSKDRNVENESGGASVCTFALHNRNCHSSCVESELELLNAKYDLGPRDCKESQEGPGLCSLISEERTVAAEGDATFTFEERGNTSSGLEACKGSHCLDPVEPKLMDSCATHALEGDGCDDFEIGTQLNELINLCMEDYTEGPLSNKVACLEGNGMDCGSFNSSCEVQCPLCGSNISDLSEELRLVHTNSCLDGDKPAKEPNSDNQNEPCGESNVEKRRVMEWLRNLGLSKYEEIFIKEEVDWETLQWLTEEDLLGMGITSLGPRKKIAHALCELRKKNDDANDLAADMLNLENTKKAKIPMNGNKLITEYFRCPSSDQRQKKACKVNTPSNLNSQKNSNAKATGGRRTVKGKVKDTPIWCCIPGTPFRVDAFRYLRGDCCHWFLTHFHVDHYQGLTKSFCHGKIYCSSVTANLVHYKIGIPWDRLHVLPLNEKITIAGVNLTCFDANHCPGAVIILFEPSNGKAVLHTGDFRFSSEMANNRVLQSSPIHTLILDTTYCNPRYDFPTQEIVIQFVIEAIQAEAFNPKTLFLIGSYTIGKERLYMEVARLLQKKIYVGAAKLQILKHLGLPQEIMHWFTANEAESHIHVVPMWTLASFKRMKYLSTQYADRFDLIVAFCPTGWSFGKGKKRTPGRKWQQGAIIRYEVPYSEHSSFTELREFVRFISPEHIIPSVNNDGPDSANAMLAQLLND